MRGSHEGTMNFPEVLGTLADAGIEGYLVDFRRGTITYYLPDGPPFELASFTTPEAVAAIFKPDLVEANVRKSQANLHTHVDFCENVKAAGCAGYLVSLLGKRVTYFGRTGETHVEMMPS